MGIRQNFTEVAGIRGVWSLWTLYQSFDLHVSMGACYIRTGSLANLQINILQMFQFNLILLLWLTFGIHQDGVCGACSED
jgi:hypothetical protein